MGGEGLHVIDDRTVGEFPFHFGAPGDVIGGFGKVEQLLESAGGLGGGIVERGEGEEDAGVAGEGDLASDVGDYKRLLDDVLPMRETRVAKCASRSPSHGSTRQLGHDRDRRKRQAPGLYSHISEIDHFPGNGKNGRPQHMWPLK